MGRHADLRARHGDARGAIREAADELERSAQPAQPLCVLVELDRVGVALRQLTPRGDQLTVERRIALARELRAQERRLRLRVWNLLAELRERSELAPAPVARGSGD